jgi:hypothetical protein
VNADELIAEIERAFADVTREDGVTLHEADVIDDYGSMAQRKKARQLDTDTRWQDVPDDLIERSPSILSFLDPIGLRYYAPAYMRWSLRYLNRSESCSIDFTIYTFDPGEDEVLSDWHRERYEIFNADQTRVIARYLRYMAEEADWCDDRVARLALERYWSRFEPDRR